ncbi:MAG: exodeoxyribonuclease III [Leptospiraceae bacterium]|jgi:exodeoxyribonuclease-3|nr:exodeoxyribonuclease III [Leptospiraceae bacterium]
MKKAYRTKKASKKSKKADTALIKEQNLFYVRELDEFPEPKNKKNLKIFSWNVNGFRAISGKNFYEWLDKEDADIVCLQETKADYEQIKNHHTAKKIFQYQYHSYWLSSEKKGYCGVATLTKIKPLKYQFGFEQDRDEYHFNNEGRIIITEFEQFILWNVYFPNGQRGPERVKYKLEFYEHCLRFWEVQRKEKYLIIAGDFNTAHKEIDLARPKENENVSGFLPEERAFLDKMVSMGYVDIFRKFDPSPGKYTYWDPITRARERNVGWRIDYFFVTEETVPFVKNAFIQMEVMGSDHCPVGLELELP